jgi:hypothetical protein
VAERGYVEQSGGYHRCMSWPNSGLRASVGAVALIAVLTSCGSSAKSTLNQAGARAAAEAMRGELKSTQLKNGQSIRDVTVLQSAAAKLPGSPAITGLVDANHDGKDDDGKVDISVGAQHACVTTNDNGRVDVSDGAC